MKPSSRARGAWLALLLLVVVVAFVIGPALLLLAVLAGFLVEVVILPLSIVGMASLVLVGFTRGEQARESRARREAWWTPEQKADWQAAQEWSRRHRARRQH